MNVEELVAIDVHVHAEVSTRDPKDEEKQKFDDAAKKYFKEQGEKPTIAETAKYYRERKMACVIFTVDGERARGQKRISNEEVAEVANENSDVMIPFASIDPAKGRLGAREARRLIEDYGVRGFKFHPQFQEFFPNDREAYPLYEVIAEAKLPALFHTGHSGMGTGMPGGGGIRLKYGNPMYVDDVAVDFPDMPIILAHPSWPWQDEALVGLHCTSRRSTSICRVGRRSTFRRSSCSLRTRSSSTKFCSGPIIPFITPDRWLEDFEKADFRDEVRPLILRENAIRLFGLGAPE